MQTDISGNACFHQYTTFKVRNNSTNAKEIFPQRRLNLICTTFESYGNRNMFSKLLNVKFEEVYIKQFCEIVENGVCLNKYFKIK